MHARIHQQPPTRPGIAILVALAATSLAFNGCAQSGEGARAMLSQTNPTTSGKATAPDGTASHTPAAAQSTARAATADQAIAQARKLRLDGQRLAALRVLDEAAAAHPNNAAVLQRQALLALEVGQIERSEKLIRRAIASSPTDWRLYSALGAALATEGRHREAVAALNRALKLSPGRPSALNNLAMSHAMSGDLATAEKLLRRVAAGSANARETRKARQNLALVLGLQGRHGEATRVGATTLPVATANANASYLQKLAGNTRVSKAPSQDTGGVEQARPAATERRSPG